MYLCVSLCLTASHFSITSPKQNRISSGEVHRRYKNRRKKAQQRLTTMLAQTNIAPGKSAILIIYALFNYLIICYLFADAILYQSSEPLIYGSYFISYFGDAGSIIISYSLIPFFCASICRSFLFIGEILLPQYIAIGFISNELTFD